MTGHENMKMHQEARRISEKAMLQAIVDRNCVATVSLHDDPYPYAVNMNYGFTWNGSPEFYFHLAVEGHKLDLLRKDPHVAITIYEYLDRHGYKSYQKETHDYRSVHAFGIAELISGEDEEAFLEGINILQRHNGRGEFKKVTSEMKNKLYVMRVKVDQISGKSQYPIRTVEETVMPPVEKRD